MLRPTERITDGRSFVRSRRLHECIGDLVEEGRRNAADLFYHFWRVTSEVPAQFLENAARMLQAQIALREAELGLAFVLPCFLCVAPLFFIPTGEKAGRAF